MKKSPKTKSAVKAKTVKRAKNNVQQTHRKGKARVPRANGNPFRATSSYGVAYDILARHAEGLPRQKFVEAVAKATGKSEKRAGFDAAVLLSAKDSPTGPRHRSCREGFWVKREGDNVMLMTV